MNENGLFSKEYCLICKSIMPLIIMFGHIVSLIKSAYGIESMVIKLLNKGFAIALVCCVALFFFIAGHGLEVSEKYKASPILLITQRIPKILIPYFVVNILYTGLTYLFESECSENVWHTLLMGSDVTWFVKVLLLCYVIYFFSQIIEKKLSVKSYLTVSGFMGIYYLFMILFGYSRLYFQTSYAFALGVLARQGIFTRKKDTLKISAGCFGIIVLLGEVLVEMLHLDPLNT